ncbi:MAG: molecular chaperone HtpG [Candidatus Methanogranum gryphiswaldense]|nr:MAG: molecular chaperone HtpG [Candidatus Methanogranum sp. U3.2.1]
MSKKQFKAESKRLLDLMANSIYTHREIFLREVISNASDAIDKLNYKAMTDQSLGVNKDDLKIKISVDEKSRTITVSDNGIGMNKDDMDKNLGVIAHSGSLDFKTEIGTCKDSNIIGQFGVGFYSTFMVSDKVTVISKAFGADQAYQWESDGIEGYTIKECEKDGFGTDVIMHLKPDKDDDDYSQYLESFNIEDLIKKYSDYIRWPIHMDVESDGYKDTGEVDENGKPKKEYIEEVQDKIINSMIPVWQKSKSEVSDEECEEFYKNKFRDFEDPICVIRINAEGTVSYKAMLFVPSKAPYDFYTRDFQPGLQLYSNGVMIMEKCADLLPFCFRFVRGVVDSPDFSLNISREVLQHDRQLKSIEANLTKKVKAELERLMRDERATYEEFYKGFGRQIEYGVVDEYGMHKDLLKDLLMFHSANNGKMISFDDYVKSMPEGQDRIYFVSADTFEHAKNLPQTEPVKDKGYDILCLTEDIDEFVMNAIQTYKEKKLCNVTTDDLGLESEEEKKEAETRSEESKELLDFIKDTLGDKVTAVRLSHKLKNHAVLLTSDGHVSIEMEKYFMSVPGAEDQKVKANRVLELNADHSAFKALANAYASDKDKAAKMSKIMYDQAVIVAGLPLEDTVGYSDLVFGLF